MLEIDGRAVRYWEEIEDVVQHSPGKELHLRISRNGKMFERYLTPIDEAVRSKRDGKVTHQGRVGITHAPFVPLVGVIDGAVAGRARRACARGDLIISDRRPAGPQLERRRSASSARSRAARASSTSAAPRCRACRRSSCSSAGFADLVPETQHRRRRCERQTYTGLEHAEMFVAHVDPGSPADGAGLKPGDLIIALDDKPVAHWLDLDQRLQAEPDATFKLTWKRAVAGGKTETLVGRGHAGAGARSSTSTTTPSRASCSARTTTSIAAPARWSRSRAASATR